MSGADGDTSEAALVVSTVTRGVSLWLSRHWLEKARRKLTRAGDGDARLDILPGSASHECSVVVYPRKDSRGAEQLELMKKHVAKATRVLVEEDLGDMDADLLRAAIRDSKNGLKDLTALEDRLKVVVYYVEEQSSGLYTRNHVRLIGAKKTIEKKKSVATPVELVKTIVSYLRPTSISILRTSESLRAPAPLLRFFFWRDVTN